MKNWKNLFLLLILVCSLIIRFYNFQDRINFGPEQAISLITSAEYIKDKITLIGLPSTQRVTSTGHIIFSSPLFNYSLMPLELMFDFDPIPITAYFALLNVLTGFIIFFLVKKLFSTKIAFLSLILFLFNNYMIFHSMFIWIVNYLPLIGILTFYLLIRFREKNIKIYSLLIGLLSGIAFGTEYLYLLTAALVFIFLIYYSKNKLVHGSFFFIGVVFASLPMIIFDLKHNFYYLSTLYQYLIDTINSPGQSKIAYYHFLQFWPLLALAGAILLAKIKNIYLVIFLCLTYILFNISSPLVSFSEAIGMNKGLNYPMLDTAARYIAQDKSNKFNVVTTWDFDSRAHPLRYLLQYRYEVTPQGVEEYKNVDNIYVMTSFTYDLNKASMYEISSFKPFNVKLLTKINDSYSVFKLNH